MVGDQPVVGDQLVVVRPEMLVPGQGSVSEWVFEMGKNLAVCPSLTPFFVMYKQNQESYDSKQLCHLQPKLGQ